MGQVSSSCRALTACGSAMASEKCRRGNRARAECQREGTGGKSNPGRPVSYNRPEAGSCHHLLLARTSSCILAACMSPLNMLPSLRLHLASPKSCQGFPIPARKNPAQQLQYGELGCCKQSTANSQPLLKSGEQQLRNGAFYLYLM